MVMVMISSMTFCTESTGSRKAKIGSNRAYGRLSKLISFFANIRYPRRDTARVINSWTILILYLHRALHPIIGLLMGGGRIQPPKP